MTSTMLLTQDAFVGNIVFEGVDTDPKSAMFHANRLTNIDMLDWAKLPYMKKQCVQSIYLKIITSDFNCIYIQKDCLNNLMIDGYEFLHEKVKSLSLEYVLPSNIKNNYDLQDIIASELIIYKYMVKRIDKTHVYLEAFIE